MYRALAVVIACLIAMLLFVGSVLDSTRTALVVEEVRAKALTEALERATAASVRDRKVLVARQAEIATSRLERAEAQEALQNALSANKPWSDTDVPTDVQRALVGAPDSPAGGL